MSEINSLLSTIDICCPHCNEYNKISNVDVSVTIDNTDLARPMDECCFDYDCDRCGKKFGVRPQMHISVVAL